MDFAKILSAPARITLAGAPEGLDALTVAGIARRLGTVLHIARDEGRMAAMAEALNFFDPELEVLTLPAWDCLPYDRISPNSEVVARRLGTLCRLAQSTPAAAVLTTVAAFTQRVPARALLAASIWQAEVGQRLGLDALVAFLLRHGYGRAETVMEPGEFAVRGGIVDLFPPGAAEPLRLDLFGDELESVRSFDPMTQRSTGNRDGLLLMPVSEVSLDEESIARFRTGYRETFGAVGTNDPLYEAVSEGRKHIGMEHWLPLFHERLETILDYLPAAPVTLDYQAEEARDARQDQIADHYQARLDFAGVGLGEAVYKPLPPERLYVTREDWTRRLQDRAVATFTPFDLPPGPAVFELGGRKARNFAPERARPEVNIYDLLAGHIAAERKAGHRVVVTAFTDGARERLGGLLRDHGAGPVATAEAWPEVASLPPATVAMATLALESGFSADGFAIISEQDILGERLSHRSRRRRRNEQFLIEASSLAEGDLVVHADHGIGRYEGLETLDVLGAPHDCLRVVYDGGDKLFVPVENIEMLSRFGSESAGVQLDKLGGAAWQARKSKLKKRIRDMADALIKVAAERQVRSAEALAPAEGLFDEFCARFPYAETDDQRRAIDETLEDLTAGRPMDRLICGDVGFGKTEVALRAAFVAALSGKQVAVVVPTTLLCRQHFRTFQARFAGLPIRTAQLSRLVAAREANQIKAEMADGKVDIVVGTHALLGKGVRFRDLGLLIIDEEQHFGVAHKERLKQLRADVHVLTLTATPIPRTLQLALTGVREMSIIATPPVDRLAVRTFVLPYDPVVIREAILREKFRNGQSFYVCPRIEDLVGVAEQLAKLVPEIKVCTAHGRLTPTELEAVMNDFYDGKYDVLLSTQIIESGLDIPTANTMVIHRADMFGLAQLYQLRGRIGRAKQRGYAYLTLAPDRVLSVPAEKRLHVMQTLDTLGAGFTLASHDLDIRGAGNLLGEEQSGHIREVGIELYQQLLEEAVGDARAAGEEGALPAEHWSPQINIGTPVLIPDSYVADLSVRLTLYRRVAQLADRAEIDGFAAELIDRFGAPLPPEVQNLLEIVAIKRLCIAANVDKVDAGPKGATLSFHDNRFNNPAGLVDFMNRQAGTAKLRPDQKLVYMRAWDDPAVRLQGVQTLLKTLANIAVAQAA